MYICEYCKKEHDGSYASGRFCSKECTKGFSTKANRKDINEKVSKKLKGKSTGGHGKIKKICPNCKKEFEVEWFKRNKICCNRSCASSLQMKNGQASKMGKLSIISQSEKRRSKNEIYFAKLCKQHFVNILENKPIFNGWDADIILKNKKIAILWNGKWHYEKITKKHSVKQVQNRDEIKINEIKTAGYFPYIIKDMGKYNKEFVEQQFEIFKKYAGSTGDSSSPGS